jgi:hypothetical protein
MAEHPTLVHLLLVKISNIRAITEVGEAYMLSPDYETDLRDGNLIKKYREEYYMMLPKRSEALCGSNLY